MGTGVLSTKDRARILEIITQAMKNPEELSLPEQDKVMDQINRSMTSHVAHREEVAARIPKTWTYLQYSHICVLEYRFGYLIEGELGICKYLQMNPALSNRDSTGRPRGAACNPAVLKEWCHMINKGGAATAKFPQFEKSCELLFSEKEMLLCNEQYTRWTSNPRNEQLWKRPDMDCTLWCKPRNWNAQLQEWQFVPAVPPTKTEDSLGVMPAKAPQPGKSPQSGGGRSGTPPPNQFSRHNRVNSHNSTGIPQIGGSRPGTPPFNQMSQGKGNNQVSSGRGSKY